MLEVIPSGINFDKPARHKEPRTVVNGEKQGLLAGSRWGNPQSRAAILCGDCRHLSWGDSRAC
jgi:hypothetical protein